MKNVKETSIIFYAIIFTKYQAVEEMEAQYLKLPEGKEIVSIWEMMEKMEGK